MRNRKSIDITAILSATAAVAAIVISSCETGPRVDRKLHAVIGRTLAKEASSLLGQGGQITIITRDTEAFRQPAMDILLSSFRREVARVKSPVIMTHSLQVDPLRPVDVPPGDFFELIQRCRAEDVIVSFLGPPVLTEEQSMKLKFTRPKVVAFCPGNLSSQIDLRQVHEAGLLHVALVCRRQPFLPQGRSRGNSAAFDQLYTIVKADGFAELPALSDVGQ
jgi:hypothetical protein